MKALRNGKSVIVAGLVAFGATAAIAHADLLTADSNRLDATVAGDFQGTRGSSYSAGFVVTAQTIAGLDASGCNATGSSPATLTVQSSKDWLTFTGAVGRVAGTPAVSNGGKTITISVNDCGTVPSQNYGVSLGYAIASGAPAAADSADVSYSISGGKAGSTYSFSDSDKKWIVSLAATTPSDATNPASTASATVPDGDDVDPDPDSYAFGSWTNESVTVTLTGSDAGGSGLKEIRYTTNGTTPTASVGTAVASGATVPFTTEGEHTLKFVAIDNAGNVETPVNQRSIKIDKTAPIVNCDSADSNWHGSDVSIACTAGDGLLSGLADSGDATFNLVTSVSANTETSNASTDSRTVYDVAGNSSVGGPVTGNMIDKKGPSVSCDAADGVWHAADASVGCTASDGGSGVSPTGDESFSLSTNVPAGTETSNAQTGTKSVSDAVGNTTTAGPVGSNMVDKKAPSITCGTAPTFTQGQSPATVSGTATDGGAGPASQYVSASASTSSFGVQSVSLSATDDVGNTGQQSCGYSVIFNWAGFFRPVDIGGVYNSVKAGSAIPVKFNLGGNQGMNIFAAGYPTSTTIACDSTADLDSIEQTVTAGQSTLQYDSVANQYVYVWKTEKGWGGSCRQLVVKLMDGTYHRANFKFTK